MTQIAETLERKADETARKVLADEVRNLIAELARKGNQTDVRGASRREGSVAPFLDVKRCVLHTRYICVKKCQDVFYALYILLHALYGLEDDHH